MAPSGIIAPDDPYWVSMRVQDTGCRVDVRSGISTCENFSDDFIDVDGVFTVVVVFVISHCSEGGTEFWSGGHRRDVDFWDRLAAWTNDLKWGSRAWRNGEGSFVRRIPRGCHEPSPWYVMKQSKG